MTEELFRRLWNILNLGRRINASHLDNGVQRHRIRSLKNVVKDYGVTPKQSKTSNSWKFHTSSSVLPDQPSWSQNMCVPLQQRKVLFDDTKLRCLDPEPALKGGSGLVRDFRSYSNKKYFVSTTSIRTIDMVFFCDWYPRLFGIDEEDIPSSEDEEGMFDIDWEDLDEKAEALTQSELDFMRKGDRAYLTDEELRDVWKRDQIPRYGRRARQKPVLEIDSRKFECICDIDEHYSRHHIRRFDGGMEREGEELRTPHFKAFWENFKERTDMADLNQSSNLFEEAAEETDDETYDLYRYIPIFPSSVPKEIKKFREKIWATFRPLDCREIRRYRMPYAEALYLELQEDLYVDSAAFFKHLIVKDHFLHENDNRSSLRLRNNKPFLNKLVIFLKLAEKLSRNQEYHKEALILVRSGKYFNDHEVNWWWLAEELYTRAIKVSQNSVIDGGKAEAIANFILGTLLLDSVDRMQLAQEHLTRARELSLGKDWNAGRILNRAQESLSQECTDHLCRALIANSKELRKSGKPEQALPLIHRSHKLCKESNTRKQNIEMETYFELGMTYKQLGMLDWAKVALRKFLEIAKLKGPARSICDGLLELAICFRSEGDMNRCHYYLQKYLETAEENKDENLIAFANRYLGEFYLNNAQEKVAEVHFKKAFLSYVQQCDQALEIPFDKWQPEHFSLPHDVELTRVLNGLALAEIIGRKILILIMETNDAKRQEAIQLLIKWKNSNLEASPETLDEIMHFESVPNPEEATEGKSSAEKWMKKSKKNGRSE